MLMMVMMVSKTGVRMVHGILLQPQRVIFAGFEDKGWLSIDEMAEMPYIRFTWHMAYGALDKSGVSTLGTDDFAIVMNLEVRVPPATRSAHSTTAHMHSQHCCTK